MNLLRRFGESFSRYRHKRGFGIHSPFGFYFITRILNEGSYAYYCYPRLNRLASSEGISQARLRRLMRISLFLAGDIISAPEASAAEIAALTASDSGRTVVPLTGYNSLCAGRSVVPFIYIARPELVSDYAEIIGCLSGNATVVISRTDTSAGRRLAEIVHPLGMTFAGSDMSVTVRRNGLPSQKFAVAL